MTWCTKIFYQQAWGKVSDLTNGKAISKICLSIQMCSPLNRPVQMSVPPPQKHPCVLIKPWSTLQSHYLALCYADISHGITISSCSTLKHTPITFITRGFFAVHCWPAVGSHYSVPWLNYVIWQRIFRTSDVTNTNNQWHTCSFQAWFIENTPNCYPTYLVSNKHSIYRCYGKFL